jgi:hypothetical protein
MIIVMLCTYGAGRAAASDTGDWNEFVHTLQAKKTPVFFSVCTIRKNDLAAIAIPVGSTTGWFYEIQPELGDRTVTLNFSKLRFDSNGLEPIEIAFGGADTLNYLSDVIRFLGRSKFELSIPIAPTILKRMEESPRCPRDR